MSVNNCLPMPMELALVKLWVTQKEDLKVGGGTVRRKKGNKREQWRQL